MNIKKKDIDRIIKDDNWKFMNRILYQMCLKHPGHKDTSIIMAKICLIGRSYSASIERRKVKGKKDGSDDFYENKVAPVIKKSNIDKWLMNLKKYRSITEHNIKEIIETHLKVMNLFNKISGLNKRSLASKYLHFHLPELFYIYDSRAIKGVRVILPNFRLRNQFKYQDDEYSKFVQKLFYISSLIHKKYSIKLTTRQLDKLLLLKS